jgi:hypothetical protein
MAYPDAFQPVGSDPKTQTLPTVSESCTGFPPLTSHCQRETIVHFDIDPLNGAYKTSWSRHYSSH